MRRTKFGEMARLELPSRLAARCEVMQFINKGSPHTHDVDEIAIATQGSGVVVVDGVSMPVKAGGFVVIPAGSSHHMEPDDDAIALVMLIGYAAQGA
ncbi:hypothetical protein LCGC14_0436830 [marine sediment metagenome]|uniref:Cupin type-2 domain-containing protein n=1 Tax=marine sediment metagenome TaxID=412755 RepID=A0A0F9SST0_9ZZZZ